MADLSLDDINKKIADINKQLGNMGKMQPFSNLKEATNELKKLEKELLIINNDLDYFSTSLRGSIQEITKVNYGLSLTKSSFKGLVSIADKFQEINKGNAILSKKEIESLRKKTNLQFEQLKWATQYGALSKQDLEEATARLNEQDAFNKALNETLEFQEKITGNTGVKTFDSLEKIIKEIPILRQFSGAFEDASKAARDIVYENEQAVQLAEKKFEYQKEERQADLKRFETGKGLTADVIKRLGFEKQITSTGAAAAKQIKALGLADQLGGITEDIPKQMNSLLGGFKALGPAIGVIVKGFIIKDLFSQILKVNKETVELQKSMALTSGEASTLRQEFSNIANESGNINVTTSALLTTVSELSKQFGFIAMFSADTLVTTTKLTQQVGISAEAAGMLAAASVSTGLNFEEQYKNALGTSYELQRQEGIQFDLRQILEESGKVTGTIRANLGTNVESIAKAVTQAKLFGASLKDVASASKALLDFESSITAELEAELLLGRNINLETARQAALNGDMVTLAKELRKEAGDYTEFSKLNVIQQEALAKSMGMQSDQLADILFQQDIQGKTARELRALGKDDLATKLEAQNVQDKFNKSIEKLSSLLGDAVTAFMPLIDVLSDVFTLIANIAKAFSPIMGTISGAAAGGAIGGPWGALIGGVIGAASDINRGISTANDAIIPTSGYGDTIIKSGKDTIALNNQDSIAVVAGTNLGGGSNKIGERTNQLLESLLVQNSRKPELSPVGLYEIQ